MHGHAESSIACNVTQKAIEVQNKFKKYIYIKKKNHHFSRMVRLCNWSYRKQHGCTLKKKKSQWEGFSMSPSYTHAYLSLPLHAFWPQAKLQLLVSLGLGGEKGSKIHRIYCVAIEILLLCSLRLKKKKENKIACIRFPSLPPPFFFRHAHKQLSKCTESCTNYGWNSVGTTIKMLSTCFKQANNMLTYITL